MTGYKKYLPLIFLGLGVVVLIISFIFIRSTNSKKGVTDSEVEAEVSFKDRPVASLTPTSDGHWLKLKIEKITLAKAHSLDYELLYALPDGRTQGVPGTVELGEEKSFERDLLLGSESSGKFRYDEGVTDGSLTIRIRDSKGKLLAKFATKWHLQNDNQVLTSVDDQFVYKLNSKPAKNVWFVVMESFGLLDTSITSVASGPYGVYSSGALPEGTTDGFTKSSTNLFYK